MSRINPSDIPDMPSADEPAKPPEVITHEGIAKLTKEITDLLSKEHDRLLKTGMAADMAASYVISAMMNANGVIGSMFINEIIMHSGKPRPPHEDYLSMGREMTLKLANAFNEFMREKLGASTVIFRVKPPVEDPPKDFKNDPPQTPPKDDWAI